MEKVIKLFLTLAFLLLAVMLFAQDSTVTAPQDPTNDWSDWVARILAAIGILLPGWDLYKAKARDKASKARELFSEFVRMVDANDFSATALKGIANRGRDVVKDNTSK